MHQPSDFRVRGLHKNAAMILGLDEGTEAPDVYIKLTPKNRQRQIKEPYVCIAAQASGQAKYWNNGRGWINVVKYLKQKGYRVLCIDRDSIYGQGSRFNLIPYGAEDFTGQIPLQERIDLLQYADFFIGLSSGLSWVANGMGKPVIMISGFTLPLNEFYTPYRLINYHVCNGCWNDTTVTFDHHDFEWCPRNKSGIKTWELKLRCEGGKRKILVVRDYGFELDCEEIKINPFKNRAERNDEILRLYNEKGLSQVFLASIFNISQPSVSLIINGKISKRK